MPSNLPEPGLSERRREQTRDEIAGAAMDLFLARGFDETTMDDVAIAAGVSRRTAYRYFPAKEDLVFEHPRRWLELFTATLAGREADEGSRDLLRRGLFAVAELIQSNPEPVLAAFSVLQSSPSLAGRHGRSNAEWELICVAAVAEDLGAGPEVQLQTAVIAGGLIGATNALIATWAAAQPDAHMPTMTVSALDQIDSIWPDATRG